MKTTTVYLLSLFFICFLLVSCGGDKDDYISKYCPGSCTVIEGRMTTANGTKPLAGINIALDWEMSGVWNSSIRKKAVTRTDADGYYELRFLIRDDEPDNGVYIIKPAIDLSGFAPCSANGTDFLFYRLERNTTVLADYNMDEVAYVEIQLNNQEAMQQGDSFHMQYSYLYGRNEEQECRRSYNWDATSANNHTIDVAAGRTVVLKTFKLKNGVSSVEETTLQLTPGEKAVQVITF